MVTKEKAKVNENIHEGHRERLLTSIFNSGLSNFNDIQILEYVLTMCIPRKDTNPLAHKLLDEFGSFSAVFDADYEELMKVYGIGKLSAMKITLFKDIFQHYKVSKIKKKTVITNYQHSKEYFGMLMSDKTVEEFYIACLNASNEVIMHKLLQKGDVNCVVFSMRDITEIVVKHKAVAIIIGHSHPQGTSAPSLSDMTTTRNITEAMAMINVDVIDHVIVGNDGIYSMGANQDLARLKNELRGKYNFLNVARPNHIKN